MPRKVLSESEHLSALWQTDGLLDLRLARGRTKGLYIETRAATLSIRFFATFGRLVKREADKESVKLQKALAKLFCRSESLIIATEPGVSSIIPSHPQYLWDAARIAHTHHHSTRHHEPMCRPCLDTVKMPTNLFYTYAQRLTSHQTSDFACVLRNSTMV